MKILVLGAGVVGLTTAWALVEDGNEVVVVDRNPDVGGDASPGNGAQLSYNFVAPFASPETLRHLPALLLERDGPTRFRPGFDPAFLRWGVSFLRHCTTAAVRRTTAAQLALAALSRAEMGRLLSGLKLEFGLRTAGKLVVYRGAAGVAAARRQVERQAALGSEQAVLDPAECLALEPGLRIARSALAGGVYTPSEQVGDCALFCQGLGAALRQRNGVQWRLGQACEPWVEGGRMRGVRIGAEPIAADLAVLCLGAGAARFAALAGVRLPIVPMKGYSLTLAPRTPLEHSVTDMDRKLVFAPLPGPSIRVAGIADFVGHDTSIDQRRLAGVVRQAREALDVDWDAGHGAWSGLRPVTPDSRPIIGMSGLPGLALNTGHGGLGWTLAMGSARLLADLVAGRTGAAISPSLFALRS